MLTIFHAPKGGSGTSVTAAAFALAAAEAHGRALLIDLCGDSPAVLGMQEPPSPGLNDWLSESHTADADALLALGTAATEKLLVVHRGARWVSGAPRWDALVQAVGARDFPVIIDAGTHFVPEDLRAVAGESFLVTRSCYMALRRASTLPKPTGIIVLREEGRALSVRDVENVLGVPAVATIPVDASIARAVDAGVLTVRWQELLGRHLPPAK